MNILCFPTDLTSTEWAAWVQAIGSIVAILAATIIAIWQSKRQHESAFALHKEEQRHNQLEQAKALLTICQNSTKAAKYFAGEMHDRETIHMIASQETYVDFGELQTLQNSTSNIPLYSLPARLITHAMALGATIRQFKQNVDSVIQLHRQMDANQFQKFFDNLGQMIKSLELTCGDIETEVKKIQQQNA